MVALRLWRNASHVSSVICHIYCVLCDVFKVMCVDHLASFFCHSSLCAVVFVTGVFLWLFFNSFVLSGISNTIFILLFLTSCSTLINYFICYGITYFFKAIVILGSNCYADRTAHRYKSQLMLQMIATVNTHHLFTFLSPVRLDFHISKYTKFYASSQNLIPFITDTGKTQNL